MNTVLVCGNAITLRDDFHRARKLFPTAPVIAVNAAGRFIKADFLYTLHPDKILEWREAAEYNAGRPVLSISDEGKRPERGLPEVPGIVWVAGTRSGGTSAWSAAKFARLYLRANTVLCGAPVELDVAKNGEFIGLWDDDDVVGPYQRFIAGDVEMHPFVRSMSGWTREVLGAPDGA